MSSNRILLDDIIRVLKEIRPWVSPDYYKENVVPIINRIRDELVLINTNEFFPKKKPQVQPKTFKDPDTIKNPVYNISIEHYTKDEDDTIPNQLLEVTSNFGIFNDNIKGDFCKKDPAAPHRYLKELSESMGRYVCYCEFWKPK